MKAVIVNKSIETNNNDRKNIQHLATSAKELSDYQPFTPANIARTNEIMDR